MVDEGPVGRRAGAAAEGGGGARAEGGVVLAGARADVRPGEAAGGLAAVPAAVGRAGKRTLHVATYENLGKN